jgi:hypothetical protein
LQLRDTEEFGSQLTLPLAADVIFHANGENPEWSDIVRVRLTASDPTIAAVEETLYVQHGPSLMIETAEDTVTHGDTTSITVKYVDANGNENWLPPNQLLMLTADSSQYGSFIDAAGATVASPLRNVLYGDARAGRISFVANGVKPKSLPLPEIKIRATTAGNSGIGSIYVNAMRLHLGSGRVKLRPLLNAHNAIINEVKQIDFSRVDTTQIFAKVTDLLGGLAAVDSVIILPFVRSFSGGHDHPSGGDTVARPTGSFMIAEGETVKVARLQTDIAGTASVIYRSSGFGGIDSIFAFSKSWHDSAGLAIPLEVDSLFLLEEGQHYQLTGAYNPPSVKSRHTVNHYGTSKAHGRVKALADTLWQAYGKRLRINDMSLEYGGPFDVYNNWRTPHRGHREGVDVDVDEKFADESVIPQRIFTGKLTRAPFHLVVGKTLLGEPNFNPDSLNHYHLNFR